jgi:phosphatidylethanolamine/phosphatidyl-N-methylethanolamine N-methyltransferase
MKKARKLTDRAYWERHAAHYDASMRVLGRPFPRMLELTCEAVRGRGRVLEVAAGTGLVTPGLAAVAKEVVATDYASAMVELLTARVRELGLVNVRCEQADIYALRFAPESFDAVVAANVLHLVPDLNGALAALQRVLKHGGKLVTPTFCHDQTWLSAILSRGASLTGFPSHRRFTTGSLCAALEGSGARIDHAEVLPGIVPIGYVEATCS